MRAFCLSLAFTVASVSGLAAQEAAFERPEDWMLRFDRPGVADSAVYFVTMEPGWHVTTGPACILYKPDQTASGEYRVESEIFQFDPEGRRREAYGVFIGGGDLQGADQRYVYFLIRDEGSFLVKRRTGNDTEVLVPWTSHRAVHPHPGGEGTAKNVLALEVDEQGVTFFINGEQATRLPRGELDLDGIVGLRVNHALNLHVTRLDVTPVAE